MRVLAGLFIGSAGVFLALLTFGVFSAAAMSVVPGQSNKIITDSSNPLVPVGFDCATVRSLGIDKQENLRAGAIMIACGLAEGGMASGPFTTITNYVHDLLAPQAYGTTDTDLITGTETPSHIIQSETFTAANPDDPNQIVVAYNDSRGAGSNPTSFSGASVSMDGGNTFTRLTLANGQSPFPNTFGDPVILYNRPTGTWFTVWLDGSCGGQGLGGFKSATPGDATSWTHFCIHNNSSDDRESGWVDNNPSSPFYGRMYVSFNDFNRGNGAMFVRYSTDNGATWTNERQLTTGFVRNVQITGDLNGSGTAYIAGMDEMGGGLGNRVNTFYKSADGGNAWSNTYTGPSFAGPGSTTCPSNSYFACMFTGPGYWRHMGWGQPAVNNGVVSYVYDSRNTGNGDPANVFYIRSADGGVTFSAPFQLNTDDTTKRQWQPSISAAGDGSLLAVWYDERESDGCVKGNPAVPCYRMWARKSLDNGVTWQPDMEFSDEVTPLPGQSDPNIVTEYAGDYDYSYQVGDKHLHTWTDGRVPINNASQQDAFFDRDSGGGSGGANLVSAASRLTQGSAGTFDINMPLAGTSGVEDRRAGTYSAVFTFDVPVTSGTATVVGGTGSAGAPAFRGNQMRVPLNGVADVQILTIRVSGVNGGGATADVPFGFLLGDVNGDRTVNRADADQVRADQNQGVTGSNFREDINRSGVVDRPDHAGVRSNANHTLP